MTNYYKNISNKKFINLKHRLVNLENIIIIPFCNKYSFYLDRERYYNESLGINLYRNINNLKDHIGLFYVDQKGEALFSFYCTKYYDTEEKRYSKKKDIEERQNIEFYEKNLDRLMIKGLNTLDSWKKDELNHVIELSRF